MNKKLFFIICLIIGLFLVSNNIDKQKAEMQGGEIKTEKTEKQPKLKSHLKKLMDENK